MMSKDEAIDAVVDAIAHIEGYYDSPEKCKALGNPYPNLPQRNNNPGNIWDGLGKGKNKRIFPSLPIDSRGFVVYPTKEDGFKALRNDIRIKVDRGMTLSQIIFMYAPPNENNTKKYLADVAKVTGLPVDKPIKEIK